MPANGTENGAEPQPRQFNGVFSSLPTTVFEEMSLLAAKHQSVNLVRRERERNGAVKHTLSASQLGCWL